jgi:hypothetical protein
MYLKNNIWNAENKIIRKLNEKTNCKQDIGGLLAQQNRLQPRRSCEKEQQNKECRSVNAL